MEIGEEEFKVAMKNLGYMNYLEARKDKKFEEIRDITRFVSAPVISKATVLEEAQLEEGLT